MGKPFRRRGIQSVFQFLAEVGCLSYHRHHVGYLSEVVDDQELISVRSPAAGFFESAVQVEQEVKEGALLARIRNPMDGGELARITAPADGIVFFLHSSSLTYEHTAVVKLIPVG